MNILGMIFSILIILSISLAAIFEKQIGAHKLRSSFVGHTAASREIFSSYEEKLYASFPGTSTAKSFRSSSTFQKKQKKQTKAPFPKINPPCARINLLPLINEGKEAHLELFKIVQNLFKKFYRDPLFDGDPKKEEAFLKAFFSALEKEALSGEPVVLEKLECRSPKDRFLLYKMLKGTKEANLFQGKGYPSLLEYVTVSSKDQLPCLHDAHPHLISLYFGDKVALKLYDSIHSQENSVLLTKELIEQYCSEAHQILDFKLFDLVALSNRSCKNRELATFVGEDKENKISLRKRIKI